jgi:membrane protein YqaA with SNARE-associated domain
MPIKNNEPELKPAITCKKENWFLSILKGPYAYWATIIVAFCESSFFPIPPDIGIITIVINDRTRAWSLALLCSIASVLGGLLGYWIGFTLFDSLGSWILDLYQLHGQFETVKTEFNTYGFWIIMLKGITPIPFKLITISCGVFKLNLLTFMIASIITRTGRFFLLTYGLWHLGPVAKPYLEKHFGWVFAFILLVVVAGIALVKVIL